MSDNQKKYEEASKAHFDAIGRPDDGNEMRAWIAGASFAEKEAHNAAIEKAAEMAFNRGMNSFGNELEKLKL